jgi:hypothetical protein
MATIASLLRERVSLQVNSVDRIFLAGYVPKLQSECRICDCLCKPVVRRSPSCGLGRPEPQDRRRERRGLPALPSCMERSSGFCPPA